MSKPSPPNNANPPPIIHYGSAHPDALSPAQPTEDSTMLLASVSEQYGASIPSTRLAKNTVDRTMAKHGQLPMFLSKTYHMVDSTDSDVVSWSEKGDAFLIKDPDKFTSEILPQYFKHSNFSSFARQLNFYGFRKLKNEPIMTSEYDAQKANYISFFHEKFQRGKPDLLIEIKRSSKADPNTNKTEADELKEEIAALRENLTNATTYYNRRLLDLVTDYERRFNQIWSALMPLLPNGTLPPYSHMAPNAPGTTTAVAPGVFQTQHYEYPMQAQPSVMPSPPGMIQQPGASIIAPPPGNNGYTMQSLSHVAGVKLQSPSVQPQLPTAQPVAMSLAADQGAKRGASEPAAHAAAKKTKVDEMDGGEGDGFKGDGDKGTAI